MGIPLVVAEPVERWDRSLRRFRFTHKGGPCPASPEGQTAACDATAQIGQVGPDDPGIKWYDGPHAAKLNSKTVSGDNWPRDDDRWPKVCERCGGAFTDEDEWQRTDAQVYRRTDGQEFSWHGPFGRSAPPGTVVRATWYDGFAARHPQADAGLEAWMVALPDGGEWTTTQEATGGGFWTVTGTVPKITVTPSIFHNAPTGWHGFITNGELVGA